MRKPTQEIAKLFLLLVAVIGVAADAKVPLVSAVRRGGALTVELEVLRDQLRVELVNLSDHPIRVNKRFSYGTDVAWTDVVFMVKDENGNALPYLTKSTADQPEARDWCYLSPDNFVGKIVSLDRLKTDYGLENKTYTIKAEYFIRAENGDVISRLSSPAVSVSFRP